MKKLILGLMLVMGFSFNANAGDPVSLVMFLTGFASGSTLNQEYAACNDLPYITAKHATGSNYYFNVSQCDYNANPSKYIVKI